MTSTDTPVRPAPTRWSRLLVALLTLSMAACASAPDAHHASAAWPTRESVRAAPGSFTPEGLAALDARMKEAVDKGEVAGLSWVLVKDGEVAGFHIHGAQAFGGTPVAEDTLFRIRSMTKPVTAVALMQLWEQGRFQLDDPVTRHVPEFAGLKVMAGEDPATKAPILEDLKAPITMRDLFTHTAGLGYGLSANNAVDRMYQTDNPMGRPNMQSAIDRIAEIPLLAQPRTRWSYSIAIDVQGAIIERLSGMPFGEYLEQNLFKPLAMTDTGFWLTEADKPRFATVYTRNAASGQMEVFPDPANRSFFVRNHMESGGGGLASTAHDYVRFVQMLLNEGELDGKRVLKPETVRMMMQNHLPDGVRAGGGAGWGLGGAVVVNAPTERAPQPVGTFSWFGIDGTWFWVDPVNKLGFVGMIQRRGNAGPGGIDLRAESAQLVYRALAK
jgi:CubicO group peptidase (beta-lactamase class C family)